MCGITGFYSEQIQTKELQLSVESLKHRGPNNQSI